LNQTENAIVKVPETKPVIKAVVEDEMPIRRVVSAVKSGCGACG